MMRDLLSHCSSVHKCHHSVAFYAHMLPLWPHPILTLLVIFIIVRVLPSLEYRLLAWWPPLASTCNDQRMEDTTAIYLLLILVWRAPATTGAWRTPPPSPSSFSASTTARVLHSRAMWLSDRPLSSRTNPNRGWRLQISSRRGTQRKGAGMEAEIGTLPCATKTEAGGGGAREKSPDLIQNSTVKHWG